LHNCPDIVSIGIGWPSNSINQDLLRDFFACIGKSFELTELFDSTKKFEEAATKGYYHLKALICYYGRHYIAFCFSNKNNQWLYLNDKKISVVGFFWNDVVMKCIKSRFQPYLLFYETDNALELNCVTAPKMTVKINKF